MKHILILLFVVHSLSLFAQNTNSETYDSTLARKLGADDYGMKMYTLVILKSGQNTGLNKAHRDSCFKIHMENIVKMKNDGKLFVAGPFGKNELNYRGIFILNVSTIEEARELVGDDAAVVEGYLEAEYLPWYGSAALGEYLPAAEKVTKKSIVR